MSKLINKRKDNPKRIGGYLIAIDSIKEQKKFFNLYTKLALIVVVPVSFFSMVNLDNFSGDSSVILSVAGLFCIMAITWSYFSHVKANKIKITQIYNTVSAKFLKVLAAQVLLIFVSLPLITIVSLSSLFGLVFPNMFEYIILVMVFLGFFAALLPTKYSLMVPIIFKEDTTSFGAFAKSAKLTIGRKFRLLFLYIIIIGAVTILTGIILQLLGLSTQLKINSLLIALINAVLLALLLPYFTIFFAKVYEKLNSPSQA